MSNLAKLDVVALDISGNNYLSWASDARMHLKKDGLLGTIDPSEITTEENKKEFIIKEDHVDLWLSLKNRFDHQKYVILPKARHEWLNLRFLDYKSVNEYNSVIFGITSRLILCGDSVRDYDMIEKMLSTFHSGNVILQEQYRAKGYTRYSELMQVLLVGEQNNELVMLNHQSRPIGSTPLPEINVTTSSDCSWQGRGRGHGQGRGRDRGRGRSRGRRRGRGFRSNNFNARKSNSCPHVNDGSHVVKKQDDSFCYRCGMTGHWHQTCRIPKHLADLYQVSQKAKENNVETNLISNKPGPFYNGLNDDTHLDMADFLADIEK